MQEVFIYILFAAALLYMGKRIRDMVIHRKKPGCADCAASEPEKIKKP